MQPHSFISTSGFYEAVNLHIDALAVVHTLSAFPVDLPNCGAEWTSNSTHARTHALTRTHT